MDPVTDEELMRHYLEGHTTSFQTLFARLAPAIHAFFLRNFREPSVSDDLLQTTFLNLHRARHAWKAAERVRPWVFSIAANVRMDELRRRYRLPRAIGQEALDRALEASAVAGEGRGRADALLEGEERAVQVRAALQRLPDSQRQVIEMNRYDDLSFGEIARALGISEGAAKLRAFRGYELLRTALAALDDRAASGGRA